MSKAKKINSGEADGKLTPLMQQYHEVKRKYPDAILLFRVGDFYETFGEDAIKVASILNIVLTSRNNGGSDIELAGFPYHSLDVYLPKLVRAGYRVAICDQLEKPSKDKKIVKRGVTGVITPSLGIDDALVSAVENKFLASIYFHSDDHFGISFLDLSIGEFLVGVGDRTTVESLLHRFQPSEVIFNKRDRIIIKSLVEDKYPMFPIDDWVYAYDTIYKALIDHFGVNSLKGFGIDDLPETHFSAGAILHYLNATENREISHINKITRIYEENFMWLDRFTIRNLELVDPLNPQGKSLSDVIDRCFSPMGSRLLRRWILMPLIDLDAINNRHNVVEYLFQHGELRQEISKLLQKTGDIERLISKSAMGKIQPREMIQLKNGLRQTDLIKTLLSHIEHEQLQIISASLISCTKLIQIIEGTLQEDAPTLLSKGDLIKDEVDPELDELRYIIGHSRELMEELLAKEAQISGIPNLKLGFNNVFGYYFEVTAKYMSSQMPEHWIRKQTLANAERYITDEIKTFENKIIQAESNIQEIEERIYAHLLTQVNEFVGAIQANASQIGKIDCLLSFAIQAIEHNYTRPSFNQDGLMKIVAGRHPIIEIMFGHDKKFIPNDLYMDPEDHQIIILTGPNMAGKSAILRQTGLIALMGQIGSFVPASSADLTIIDKLYTRVGASDNISGGESTFMVEMNETASILNNISDRSLILLDEIGRGTSTYDGISIAWSIVEYLHNNTIGKPKTLFATHYHELNELSAKLSRVKNFNVAIKEYKDKIIFLYQLMPGGSEHSFGIHVAKMAGMPQDILTRANQILKQLEDSSAKWSGNKNHLTKGVLQKMEMPNYQLSIFESSDPSIAAIREILLQLEPEHMTPIDSLIKLNELKRLAIKSLE